jgi:tRNA threonylcarbamoyladenosine biosynthesis protein TsaE
LKLAEKFSKRLKGGEVLCLVGDLGAGKTAFTKGLAKGLGVHNIITSPTFVLLKPYVASSGKINKLVHIDAYRLDSVSELDYIGVEEYFIDKNCITVIEWADKVKDIWPKNKIIISFRILAGDKREITIK